MKPAKSLASLLSVESSYPHSHTFSSPEAFRGLQLHYKALPDDWPAIALEATEARLKALGFESPVDIVLNRIGGVPLTGDDLESAEKVHDELPIAKKKELEDIIADGVRAICFALVGGWNADESLEENLPVLLKRFPEFTVAVFKLASNVTMPLSEQETLSK